MDSKTCGKFDDKELRVIHDALIERRYLMEIKEPERGDADPKTRDMLEDIEGTVLGCIYADQFVSKHKETAKA